MRINFLLIVLSTLLIYGCNLNNINQISALVPPTVDQEPALPHMVLTINRIQRAVHLESFGHDSLPCILVLHGSASDYRAYLVLKALTDKYRVIFWDQRGCGLSERISKEEFSWETCIEEVHALKQHFSPNKPVSLISHSWGGVNSALYASRYPQMIDQLIFIEPGPAFRADILKQNMKNMIEINLLNTVFTDMELQAQCISISGHEQMDYRYMMNLKSTMVNYFCDKKNIPHWPLWRAGVYVEYIRQELLFNKKKELEFDFTAGFSALKQKVLILAGECGALGYEFQMKYHAPLFPHVEVKEIPNAGHRLIVEAPGLMLTEMKKYLNEYKK